jgi:hypothetical protein
MHGNESRPDQFPHIYELLKAIPGYIGRTSVDPHDAVDKKKFDEAMEVVSFAPSEGLKDTVYRDLYTDYRTSAIIKMSGEEVSAENFRQWLEAYNPINRMHWTLALRLKERIAAEAASRALKVKEALAKFFEKEADVDSGWGSMPPVPLVRKTTLRPGDAAGRIRAETRSSFGNLAMPMMTVGRSGTEELIDVDEGAELAYQFAKYIGEVTGRGAAFNFRIISEICELIFDKDIAWFDSSGKITWEELVKLDLFESFSACKNVLGELEGFAAQLHYWTLDLRQKGLCTDEERAKFVRAIKALNLPRK